eukprot:COSAG05_NODE_7594_length_792_cov_0.968254_1_plen_143_part_01
MKGQQQLTIFRRLLLLVLLVLPPQRHLRLLPAAVAPSSMLTTRRTDGSSVIAFVEQLKTDDLTAHVGRSGNLEVSSGKFVVSISSSFATNAGTNTLPEANSWQVSTTHIAPTLWCITAACSKFLLVRKVTVDRWRVLISDSIK